MIAPAIIKVAQGWFDNLVGGNVSLIAEAIKLARKDNLKAIYAREGIVDYFMSNCYDPNIDTFIRYRWSWSAVHTHCYDILKEVRIKGDL